MELSGLEIRQDESLVLLPYGLQHLAICATGDTDIVIDALALHDYLPLLQPIFADASILKVRHVAVLLSPPIHPQRLSCREFARPVKDKIQTLLRGSDFFWMHV